MVTHTTRQRDSQSRPIITLLSDKECIDAPAVDGFVMPPLGTSLHEAFDLLEELSHQHRQARSDDSEMDEDFIDFVIRHGFTEVEDDKAGWFNLRDREW